MAEQQRKKAFTKVDDQRKKALEKVDDQVSCAVCLEDYTEPKVLACLHVFCKKCLERLVIQDAANRIVLCPNCRGTTRLPQDGVSQLQSAFYIHHLFEVRDILQKVSAADKTTCDKCGEGEAKAYCRDCGGFVCELCLTMHKKWKDLAGHEISSLEDIEKEVAALVPPKKVVMTCSKHPNEQLKLYCDTCNELICRDCTIKAHRDHQYDLVNDCFQKHKDAILKSLQPTKRNLGIVSGAIAEVKARSDRLETRGKQTKEGIRGTIDRLHDLLEARKRELSSQVDDLVKASRKSLDTQCGEFELTQTQLSSCVEFVEESLRTGTHEEVLSLKKQVVERAEQMTRDFDPAQFQLKPELQLSFGHDDLAASCKSFGVTSLTPLCIPQCYATGPGLKAATVNRETGFSVYTVTENGEKCEDPNAVVTGELVSEDGRVVKCQVSKKEDNRYELRYKPQHKGRFQLHVKVNGSHSKDSPFLVQVVERLQVAQGTHVKTIGGLRFPRQLAVSDSGEIVVAEQNSHCVSVFDREGRKLRSFGSQGSADMKLVNPLGVALLSDNTVLVAAEHCVKKFRMDGTFIASVGSKGSGKLQFNSPYAVAADERGKKIYVCDTYNHRIQVLNFDLSYHSSFGSKGIGPQQFNTPEGIAIDSHQNVFVADYNNHRVQVFNSEGRFQHEIKPRGAGMEELDSPLSVCIDRDDNVYVLERFKCRVSIFSNKGDFIKSFGRKGNKAGEFDRPCGIAVDNSGCVYISDSGNKRIQIFS